MRKQRNPEDFIGRFTRSEIDRSIGAYSRDFHVPDGRPLIQVAVDILRENGEVSLFDGGCGTGRALWELRDQLLARAKGKVRAVGVNRDDFSDESELAAVRQAVQKGDLTYRVGELEQTPISKNEFDIITFYEVLIHNSPRAAAHIIDRYLSGLREGGWLFASLDRGQYQHPDFRPLIQKTSDAGVWQARVSEKKSHDGESRLFLAIQRLNAKTK